MCQPKKYIFEIYTARIILFIEEWGPGKFRKYNAIVLFADGFHVNIYINLDRVKYNLKVINKSLLVIT